MTRLLPLLLLLACSGDLKPKLCLPGSIPAEMGPMFCHDGGDWGFENVPAGWACALALNASPHPCPRPENSATHTGHSDPSSTDTVGLDGEDDGRPVDGL